VKKKNIKKKLIYLSTDHPDYFLGHSGRTFIAFWNPQSTIKEVLDSLLLNALNECVEPEEYDAIHDYVKHILFTENGSDQFSPSLNDLFQEDPKEAEAEEESEDPDPDSNEVNYPIVYFGIIEEEEESDEADEAEEGAQK